MKTSLSHLPESKQKEIADILEIIKEEAKPEKVILFGSYAKGTWVEDDYFEDGIRYSYISDYDFLVVLKESDQREYEVKSRITNRCKNFTNVISPLVHDIDYINYGLGFGQYFFTEIISEGILLYDTENYSFAKPKELTPTEQQEKARDYFDIWYPRAVSFLKLANFCLAENDLNVGAFQLHQATECFYNASLLVHVGYKPKSHNLENLRNYAKHISTAIYTTFLTPSEDLHEKHLFELLKRAYIDARYKKEYIITEAELKELIEKVTRMQELVKTICEEKIDSFIVE